MIASWRGEYRLDLMSVFDSRERPVPLYNSKDSLLTPARFSICHLPRQVLTCQSVPIRSALRHI